MTNIISKRFFLPINFLSKEIKRCEEDILKALDYNLVIPTSSQYFDRIFEKNFPY